MPPGGHPLLALVTLRSRSHHAPVRLDRGAAPLALRDRGGRRPM